MIHITDTNAIKTENGFLFKTKEHYIVTEFTVKNDGYYDISVGYAHIDPFFRAIRESSLQQSI